MLNGFVPNCTIGIFPEMDYRGILVYIFCLIIISTIPEEKWGTTRSLHYDRLIITYNEANKMKILNIERA